MSRPRSDTTVIGTTWCLLGESAPKEYHRKLRDASLTRVATKAYYGHHDSKYDTTVVILRV